MAAIFKNKQTIDFYIDRLERELKYYKILEQILINKKMLCIDNLCTVYDKYEEMYDKDSK